jgi:hypothetical protein
MNSNVRFKCRMPLEENIREIHYDIDLGKVSLDKALKT